MPKKLAIIAGGGELPNEIIRYAPQQGWSPIIIGLRDNIHHPQAHFLVGMGQVGRLMRYLRQHDIADVMFCGVMQRPNLWRLRLDWHGLRCLPKVYSALRGGDNKLMQVLVRIFEQEGFTVPMPQHIAPQLLMPQGVLTRRTPSARDLSDIQHGLQVLQSLGQLDIGQACVVAGGRVLAVEAVEGTAAMLQRVAQLPPHQRGQGGVLVKNIKPNQELRADLPTIGEATLNQAASARLNGIALGSGHVFVLHQERVVQQANTMHLFLAGVVVP